MIWLKHLKEYVLVKHYFFNTLVFWSQFFKNFGFHANKRWRRPTATRCRLKGGLRQTNLRDLSVFGWVATLLLKVTCLGLMLASIFHDHICESTILLKRNFDVAIQFAIAKINPYSGGPISLTSLRVSVCYYAISRSPFDGPPSLFKEANPKLMGHAWLFCNKLTESIFRASAIKSLGRHVSIFSIYKQLDVCWNFFSIDVYIAMGCNGVCNICTMRWKPRHTPGKSMVEMAHFSTL